MSRLVQGDPPRHGGPEAGRWRGRVPPSNTRQRGGPAPPVRAGPRADPAPSCPAEHRQTSDDLAAFCRPGPVQASPYRFPRRSLVPVSPVPSTPEQARPRGPPAPPGPCRLGGTSLDRPTNPATSRRHHQRRLRLHRHGRHPSRRTRPLIGTARKRNQGAAVGGPSRDSARCACIAVAPEQCEAPRRLSSFGRRGLGRPRTDRSCGPFAGGGDQGRAAVVARVPLIAAAACRYPPNRRSGALAPAHCISEQGKGPTDLGADTSS